MSEDKEIEGVLKFMALNKFKKNLGRDLKDLQKKKADKEDIERLKKIIKYVNDSMENI